MRRELTTPVRWRPALGLALLGWGPILFALGIVVVPSGMAGIRVSQTQGTLAGTLYPGACPGHYHHVRRGQSRLPDLAASVDPDDGYRCRGADRLADPAGCQDGVRRTTRPLNSRTTYFGENSLDLIASDPRVLECVNATG